MELLFYNKIKSFLRSLDWRSPSLSFILPTRKEDPCCLYCSPPPEGDVIIFADLLFSQSYLNLFLQLYNNSQFSCFFSSLSLSPTPSCYLRLLLSITDECVFSEVRSKSSTSAPFFTTTAPRQFCHNNCASKISQTQTHSDGGQIRVQAAVYLWAHQQIRSWRSIKLWLILRSEEGRQEWARFSFADGRLESEQRRHWELRWTMIMLRQ